MGESRVTILKWQCWTMSRKHKKKVQLPYRIYRNTTIKKCIRGILHLNGKLSYFLQFFFAISLIFCWNITYTDFRGTGLCVGDVSSCSFGFCRWNDIVGILRRKSNIWRACHGIVWVSMSPPTKGESFVF